MKSIVFYTHARLGDLHVSRTFVRRIAQHVTVPCYYCSGYASFVLADCCLAPIEQLDRPRYLPSDAAHFIKDDVLYINTWYAAGNGRYVRDGQAPLFDTLYRLFDDVGRSHLHLPLENLGTPADFLPDIDFRAYQLDQARSFMQSSPARRKVLVSNGRATAGQAALFPMLPPLAILGQKYPDVLFIYTNQEYEPVTPLPPNVHFSRGVTGIAKGVDLNENGYLSTRCDLIVGRFSGAYTFSMIKPNFHRPVHFLTFSNVAFPYWVGSEFRDRINFGCTVTQSGATESDPVLAMMDSAVGAL